MGVMASQINSHTIVYSTVYSDVDQRKHQSSASLAFVRGIHRGLVNSSHKWPVTRKMFPFDDVIMFIVCTEPFHKGFYELKIKIIETFIRIFKLITRLWFFSECLRALYRNRINNFRKGLWCYGPLVFLSVSIYRHINNVHKYDPCVNNFNINSIDSSSSLIWVSIGSGNGLSPLRCQAIAWTNAAILSIGLLGTNFSEIWIKLAKFSFIKMYFKISSAKRWSCCPAGGGE